MPNGFPAYRQSHFPNDQPPSLFHPASPKVKPAMPSTTMKESDTTSIASTSTFASTMGLLKDSVKSKLPLSYKEYRARKDAAAQSAVTSEKQEPKLKEQAWRDPKTPRQRTAEAYMVFATTK